MMRGALELYILISLFGNIGLISTQDYQYKNYNDDYEELYEELYKNYNDDYEEYGDDQIDHDCGQTEHFCSSINTCKNASEVCDGKCGRGYHFCHGLCLHYSEACNGQCGFPYQQYFCSFNDLCLYDFEPCDGQCREDYHFCPLANNFIKEFPFCNGNFSEYYRFCGSTINCIPKSFPCNGKCQDDYPNLCDNGTVCYTNSMINDRVYECKDRSDEHHPKKEHQRLDNYSVDKFLQLQHLKDLYGEPGVDCEDGTLHPYRLWCKEQHSRMCGNVSTIDYFVCHNSSLWEDRPCDIPPMIRGCKVPGKCIYEYDHDKCNTDVGNAAYECGSNDYSRLTCSVNEFTLKEKIRYFRCNDNSSLIHPTLVCDGFIHCGDASDEDECDNCPRVNNIEIHNQVVQLKTEELRDLAHLKVTAIMKCKSPYGRPVCATPGDGIAECSWEFKEGQWQTQDEVELTSATLWWTIFKYMYYIFLVSVVVLTITQWDYLCQKSPVDIPVLISYRKTNSSDDDPLPLAIHTRSFTDAEYFLPTPFFTTTEPMQLTNQFKQYYILNHRSEHFKEFLNFCLTLSLFLSTRIERDLLYCGIYALEAQIHNMSPTCTDQCLKQHSSDALGPLFDAVYGSFSDRLPNEIKNALFTKDKLLGLNYLLRIKTFLFRYFFFYYDIIQEYVLLSFILGTVGLGVSTTTWLNISDFDYITIIVYMYVVSVFLPMILFSLQLAFSSKNGIIFGVEKPSVQQKIFFGLFCFTLFPFIPTALFFRIENLQMKMFKVSNRTSKVLGRQCNQNSQLISLENKTIDESKILMDINTDITKAKSLYKQFKEWELAIEMPIQSSLTIIFSFMKKSTTVVNQVFQNWFISDTKSLILLIFLSLRSIIAVQISDESARRNNFLGIKSKILLAPLYMMTSIPRIASIVIYAAVPLGLMDLLGHWTVEKEGNSYYSKTYSVTLIQLMDCTKKSGYSGTLEWGFFNSTIFSADAIPTKYTAWDTSTYVAILMALLGTSVMINFVWLSFSSRKSLSEKILSSSKSTLSIIIDSDFDENDESVKPDQLQLHYQEKFDRVHKEYISKLLFHTGTNIVLTFPWTLAYQKANERHQLLMEIGDCLGVKGTVEMEDISLERLWWGQWVLPLVMAVLGVLNYGWFRLYINYGHPWRRLLTPDSERIEEWRTLKLWEMLGNQNYNEGEIRSGNDLN